MTRLVERSGLVAISSLNMFFSKSSIDNTVSRYAFHFLSESAHVAHVAIIETVHKDARDRLSPNKNKP